MKKECDLLDNVGQCHSSINFDQVILCNICYIRIYNSLSCFQGHYSIFIYIFYLILTLTYISFFRRSMRHWLCIFLSYFHSMFFWYLHLDGKISKLKNIFVQYSLICWNVLKTCWQPKGICLHNMLATENPIL